MLWSSVFFSIINIIFFFNTYINLDYICSVIVLLSFSAAFEEGKPADPKPYQEHLI